jgi:hypothetical protein
MERRSRPPFSLDKAPPSIDDVGIELALQLAAFRHAYELDDVVVAALDGRLLAAVGDPDVDRSLAVLAVTSVHRQDFNSSMHCHKVWIEPVSLFGQTCVFAAKASHPLAAPADMARALERTFALAAPVIDEGCVDGQADDLDAAFGEFFDEAVA